MRVDAQLPASDADAAARRDHEAAALAAQIRKLDAQQDAQVRALEDVPDGPAGKAMRARINERFTQLHAERTYSGTRHIGNGEPAVLVGSPPIRIRSSP